MSQPFLCRFPMVTNGLQIISGCRLVGATLNGAGRVLVLSYPIIPNDPSLMFFFYGRGLRAGSPILPFAIQLAQQP
jgi:hypothetical protein